MKSFVVALTLGLALGLFAAQTVGAAGFGLYEWSARGNALGGTMVGRADDASALAYNPAGITQLGDGIHIQAGASAIVPNVDVNVQDPYTAPGLTTKASTMSGFRRIFTPRRGLPRTSGPALAPSPASASAPNSIPTGPAVTLAIRPSSTPSPSTRTSPSRSRTSCLWPSASSSCG